jgi:hypothetical protein
VKVSLSTLNHPRRSSDWFSQRTQADRQCPPALDTQPNLPAYRVAGCRQDYESRGEELTFRNREKQLSVVSSRLSVLGCQLPELSNLIRMAADPKELTTDNRQLFYSAEGTADPSPAFQGWVVVIRKDLAAFATIP